MFLWGEASLKDIYIQNRSCHQILEYMTIKEVFSRRKPKVLHMIIFGCLVYIQVPMDKRNKLEPSGEKGIFIGYSE